MFACSCVFIAHTKLYETSSMQLLQPRVYLFAHLHTSQRTHSTMQTFSFLFLVNNQHDAQILFSVFLFLFTTLYMFRAHSAHHQERKIVSIQPVVTVILCWWPRCVQVGRTLLPTCTLRGHQHRMTVTRGCVETLCLSWWWALCARNM